MKLKYYFLLILFAMGSGFISAQETTQESEENFSFEAGSDLVSRYVWRGISLSNSPALQPTLSLSYKNFTFGSWGSYTLSSELLQEVDLFMSYSLGSFTFTINDYFNPTEPVSMNDYFHWTSNETRHAVEGMVSFDGPEDMPFQILAGVFLYGNDKDADGKNYYSSYVEANYTWEKGEYSVSPFLGFSPWTGLYSDGFKLVNLGVSATRSLKVNDNLEFPLKVSFITNPDAEDVFLVLGITF